ncbi:hypothetical protein M569_14743, partial [Genlisea aurea]
EKMEDVVVLYSGTAHLNSIKDLAVFIGNHHPSISVILMSFDPVAPDFTATPSVTYHFFPTPEIPPEIKSDHVGLYFEIPRLNNSRLKETLRRISEKSRLRAIVIDFFCTAAFEVSSELGIPSYYCHTSGASGLAAMLYWPTIHENIAAGAAELDDFVVVPGCPAIPTSELPWMMRSLEGHVYELFLGMAMNARKSDGIVCFTFNALEFRAIEAITNGLCVPEGRSPPIYPIGPFIGAPESMGGGERHDCLRWLDLQPRKSVVFLCFGRWGKFSGEQLKEIANGLENSGLRFLWVVRNPPEILAGAAEEPDLEALLPEGFLERTRQTGFVLKSWAPQTEVLAHDSVGGFVSHCGHNSILEAAANGVPIIGWPLYAEQRMNRVFLVEEIGLALPLEEGTGGLVTAAELEKRVRELMESKTGRELRRRAEELKHSAAAALKPGGSSVVNLEKFI